MTNRIKKYNMKYFQGGSDDEITNFNYLLFVHIWLINICGILYLDYYLLHGY